MDSTQLPSQFRPIDAPGGLPISQRSPTRRKDGIQCSLYVHQCRIPEGGRGFCGMRPAYDGRLVHLAGTLPRGLPHWHPDPLPVNCVADRVCRGHLRREDHNLAVFYASCTPNCLLRQNWHFRETNPNLDRQGTIEAIIRLLSLKD